LTCLKKELLLDSNIVEFYSVDTNLESLLKGTGKVQRFDQGLEKYTTRPINIPTIRMLTRQPKTMVRVTASWSSKEI